MKIAIIEDEGPHAQLLALYLGNWSKRAQIHIVVRIFSSAESFLFAWENEKDFDVLFVDIQMRGMNGMDLAKRVRRENARVAIIFTTGITDYMEEGYEVEALHYLVKPLEEEKVAACMSRVVERQTEKKCILLRQGNEICKMELDRINYIEACGHGCLVSVAGGGERVCETSDGISQIEKMLPDDLFVRCHRSYLCGIHNIRHIDRTEIIFDDGSRIPVSRRLRNEVNQLFIRYYRQS